MCFSATASFIAGGALSVAGVATVKKAKKKSEIPFALIPLLFGIQQLTEGLVWLSLHLNTLTLNIISTHIYVLFAYIFWPVYVPFAVRSLETVPWRKKTLLFFQIIGAVAGAYILYFQIQSPVTSQIINKSIVYTVYSSHSFWVPLFYISATCISALFSSHRTVKILGVLVFISAMISYWFYISSFESVWCYFSAILSLVVYLHFTKIKFLSKNDRQVNH